MNSCNTESEIMTGNVPYVLRSDGIVPDMYFLNGVEYLLQPCNFIAKLINKIPVHLHEYIFENVETVVDETEKEMVFQLEAAFKLDRMSIMDKQEWDESL